MNSESRKLLWTKPAETDKNRIVDRIAEDNPAAAVAMEDRINEAASKIFDNPYMGKKSDRLVDSRELVFHRSYVMPYKIDDNGVVILRVLPTRMQRQ